MTAQKRAIFSRRALLAGSLPALAVATARAQDEAVAFPQRQVSFIVPFAPAGGTDILARILAQKLEQRLGKPFVVENRPGAGTILATNYIAKSPPDGYTIAMTVSSLAADVTLYKSLPYNPATDLVLVALIARVPFVLVVNPSLPVNSVKELIARAKTKPGELNYGTFGIGSSGHLNMALFESVAGVRLTPVHYKGATPALTDLMAGHIQLMFISVGSAVPQWKAGKVRILAVGASKRLDGLPDVPTVAESGLPGFEAVSWFGLYGPAGLPPDIVAKANAELRALFADPEVRQSFLAPQFFEPLVDSPAELAGFLDTETKKWGKVIRDARIKVE